MTNWGNRSAFVAASSDRAERNTGRASLGGGRINTRCCGLDGGAGVITSPLRITPMYSARTTDKPKPAVPAAPARLTLAHLQKMYRERERITMVACYDATGAAVVDAAGVEILLVGDSLGMLVQGA